MIKSQELDEFIAVRVQDPRFQNEGSWNSYVDFKIFLHTNSKAFTAKTSCVRRRYSEFVWLKKKLQKNAGLVPVPDLPSKTAFFSFNNDDFIERRRQGLQHFLDKVLHMTVCLSDSQLHLFLQTQLPVRHIEDCVQGHTPYTVTDAILTYASSNQGWAQEELSLKQESSLLPVSYESVDSPAPHLPTLPSEDGLKFKTCEVGGDMDDAYTETTSKTSNHTSDSNCNDTLVFKDVEGSMWGIYSPGTNAKDNNRIVFSPCEAEASVEHADETQVQKADVCKTSNFVFEADSSVVDTHSSNVLEVIMHETDGYSDL